jgi:hypothetical protein
LTANEFISKLSAKGVDVLFNQASTGYVSGISYGYKGMIVKGAKPGNDFKWSAIKNKIDYEQERDRTTIYACPPKLQRRREANVRSQSAVDQLRAGNEHARGNPANTQAGPVRYGKLPDSTQDLGLCVYRPSFTARLIKASIGEAERATDGFIGTAFKIPKVIPPATLLDSYSRGRDVGAVNESDRDYSEGLTRRKRKKRRRGLGL